MEIAFKVCIVCFKSNTQTPLLDLWDTEENNVLADKLQFFAETKLVHTEFTLLCTGCAKELNDAYEFRMKVVTSQNFWHTACIQSGSFIQPDKSYDTTCNVENKDATTTFNAIDNYAISNNLELKEHTVAQYVAKDCLMHDNLSISEKDINISAIINELDNPDDPTGDFVDSECLDSIDYSCVKCSVIFPSESELLDHTCNPSTDKEESKKINTRKKYKKRKPSQQQALEFICYICGYSTDKNCKLQKHNKTVHSGKTFKCNYCLKAFKQAYHLREHITIHTGEKNYSCNFCDKKFQRISSQKRHIRSHDAAPGEKVKKRPYLCPICGKKFPYANGAKRHMRTHTGERTFKCKICHKRFNQSTHLNVHLRVHTGEKPYMCNICGDTFTLKAILQKHINSHNEDKDDIYQNLEPNLSQTLHNNIESNELVINELEEFSEVQEYVAT